MGGTSTDVCLISGGRAERTLERSVGGLPIRLPMVDIHTVGAGGGSIVWRDAGGAVRVGPESAGANPGPACYGRGGERPTVTDANLLLGRLPERLAGGVELDRDAAERAMDGFDPADVVEVVNAEMLRALRVVSVERGHDPRDFALVAFGGAGPLHACALAEELGISTRARPRGGRGAVGARSRRERGAARPRALVRVPARGGGRAAGARARPTSATAGQSFELTVPLGDDLAERFHRAHEERYGYADPARPVELVAVRTARSPAPALRARRAAGGPLERVRPGPARAGRRHLLDPPRVGGGSGSDATARCW